MVTLLLSKHPRRSKAACSYSQPHYQPTDGAIWLSFLYTAGIGFLQFTKVQAIVLEVCGQKLPVMQVL